MSFKDWITGSYPNPSINGRWGWLHITVLCACVAIIIALALIFRKRSEKARKIVVWVLVGLILLFEIARRIINFCKLTEWSVTSVLHTLLPRPWCAIACWTLIASVLVNKKWLYNFASASALLCSMIFFAYPGVGFNNKFILFENLYSIATHSLLLITSVTLITLKFTKFEYKTIWKSAIVYAAVVIYAILEIYVLKIETDPLYFMPGNDIESILGVPYGLYLALYIIVSLLYFNVFYLIDDRKSVFRRRRRPQ